MRRRKLAETRGLVFIRENLVFPATARGVNTPDCGLRLGDSPQFLRVRSDSCFRGAGFDRRLPMKAVYGTAKSVRRCGRAFMRGVLLREFLDMVDRHFGPEVTERLGCAAGLSSEHFSSVPALPHIHRLVHVLSEQTGVVGSSILIAYGENLFRRLAGMHPELLDTSDAFKCFESVLTKSLSDSRDLDPAAAFPEFTFVRSGARQIVECRSSNPIADVAEGLVRGCLSYCRSNAAMRRTDLPGPPGHAARFEVAATLSAAA